MQLFFGLDVIEVCSFFGERFRTVKCGHELCLVGLLENFKFDDDEECHYC